MEDTAAIPAAAVPTPEPEPEPGPPAKPAEIEIGGPKERDPTRYGDWTVKGRAIDF